MVVLKVSGGLLNIVAYQAKSCMNFCMFFIFFVIVCYTLKIIVRLIFSSAENCKIKLRT